MENTEIKINTVVDNLKKKLIEETVGDKETFQGVLDRYSALEVADVEDMVAYNGVINGLKELQKYRINIEKTRKLYTKPLTDAQKELIAIETEFVGLIKPIEEGLTAKKKTIDDKKEAIKNAVFTKRNKELLENGFQLVGKFYISGVIQVEAVNLSELDENEYSQYLEHGRKEIERKAKEDQIRQEKINQANQAAEKLAKENAELRAQIETHKKLYPENNTVKPEAVPEIKPETVKPETNLKPEPKIIPVDKYGEGFESCKTMVVDLIKNPAKYGIEKLTKEAMISAITDLKPSELW